VLPPLPEHRGPARPAHVVESGLVKKGLGLISHVDVVVLLAGLILAAPAASDEKKCGGEKGADDDFHCA